MIHVLGDIRKDIYMEKTDSILISTKAKIGVDPEDDSFDGPIIDFINSVFAIMTQFASNLEHNDGFEITGETETWDDFTSDPTTKALVKTYIYQKVKLVFDPPASSVLMEQYKESIKEFEFRLGINYKGE